jgi:hypothetical protein
MKLSLKRVSGAKFSIRRRRMNSEKGKLEK